VAVVLVGGLLLVRAALSPAPAPATAGATRVADAGEAPGAAPTPAPATVASPTPPPAPAPAATPVDPTEPVASVGPAPARPARKARALRRRRPPAVRVVPTVQPAPASEVAPTEATATVAAVKPVLSGLRYDRTAAVAGMPLVVTGQFGYRALPGTRLTLLSRVAMPGGAGEDLPGQPIIVQGARGQARFSVPILPREPGIYRFDLWVLDARGQASNHLRGSIKVGEKSPQAS
jgi:hypothetical protein